MNHAWRCTGPAGVQEGTVPVAGLRLEDPGVVALHHGTSATARLLAGEPLLVSDDGGTLRVAAAAPGWPVDVIAPGSVPVSVRDAGSILLRGWLGPLRAAWTGRRAAAQLRPTPDGRAFAGTLGLRRVRVQGIRLLTVEPAKGRTSEIRIGGPAQQRRRLPIELRQGELLIGGEEHVNVTVTLTVPAFCRLEIVDVNQVAVGDTHNRVHIRQTRPGVWRFGQLAELAGYATSTVRVTAVADALRLFGWGATIEVGRSTTRLVRAVLLGGSLRFSGRTQRLELLAADDSSCAVAAVEVSAFVRAAGHSFARFRGGASQCVQLFAESGARVLHNVRVRPPQPRDRLRLRGSGTVTAYWLSGALPVGYGGDSLACVPATDEALWDLDRPLTAQGLMDAGLFGGAAMPELDGARWVELPLEAGVHATDLDAVPPLVHRYPPARLDWEWLTEGLAWRRRPDGLVFVAMPGGPALTFADLDVGKLPVAWLPRPGAQPRHTVMSKEALAISLLVLGIAARASDPRVLVLVGRSCGMAVAAQALAVFNDRVHGDAGEVRELLAALDRGSPEGWEAEDRSAAQGVFDRAFDRWLAAERRDGRPQPPDWDALRQHGGDWLTVDGGIVLETGDVSLRLDAPTDDVATGTLRAGAGVPSMRVALRVDDAFELVALLLAAAWLRRGGLEAVPFDALGRWPCLDPFAFRAALVRSVPVTLTSVARAHVTSLLALPS